MRQSRASEAADAVFAYRPKSLFIPGSVRGAIVCLSVCLSVCVCVPFVVVTDCESCTRPVSTKPGSMETGKYGLTRGTCFVARRCRGGRGCRAAVDCVVCFGVRRDFVFFFSSFFFAERSRPTASTNLPCLIYLCTSNEAVVCL